ncbi:hypothetical protein D3C72_2244960 [compost metagenome]
MFEDQQALAPRADVALGHGAGDAEMLGPVTQLLAGGQFRIVAGLRHAQAASQARHAHFLAEQADIETRAAG